MRNYIVSAKVDIRDGLLRGTMEFLPGLNIISGENGTLKTQLLQALRGGGGVQAHYPAVLRMQTFSPKRNSERRASEAILQFFRQNNRTWESNVNERIGAQINTSGFDNYPSLGDLYYLLFEHRCKDGTDRTAHMEALTGEFNGVIQSVFPHYCLQAHWDKNLGAPRIGMCKHGHVEFPIEGLSMGEQEVLSLILSIHTGRDNVDVYLIDEPEVHLNWHLEERLFSFLDDFCENTGKQAIVVTHSRTIFKPRFFPKAQFLRWGDDQRVAWGKDLTPQQRSRLAGDAIEIVALGDFTKPTLFVEDHAHANLIKILADTYGANVTTSQCGNSTNVKSLYQYQLAHGRWANAHFMIDGDNQGNPFPHDEQFIHLPYYCVENIMLDPETLAAASGRSLSDVQETIVASISSQRKSIFQRNKFFEFLADRIDASHMTFENLRTFDASMIVADVFRAIEIADHSSYFLAARANGRIEVLVPKQLLRVLESAIPASAQAAASLPATEAVSAEARLVENSAHQFNGAGG
ncbi:AAA family ATPase [Delftia sp. HK171]|uniref:AAA family ATPase n=1 Tax=Delftia sp. HK171 TaxID=1920191 RepID=UPI0018DB8194|nr:AAA family ATPase [Delftia sp. HK171]